MSVLLRVFTRQVAMQSIPQIPAAPEAGEAKPERLASDVVYQGMTIVEAVWLLVSLWGF